MGPLTPFLLILLVFAASTTGADPTTLDVRRAYNSASAKIDSVVRTMGLIDAEALENQRVPDTRETGIVPEGMAAVLIFWADDEAQVWINDFLVGVTRLTPVEVTVPSLYLREENQIRARCWDTDWVESGFMCGFYLRDESGGLHPVVVSDGQWETPRGRALEITYAHPSPDIPQAEPIWGPKVFGVVELSTTFQGKTVREAAAMTGESVGALETKRSKMDYHRFLGDLAVLQERRDALKKLLESQGDAPEYPVYFAGKIQAPGLTLGKAGLLEESISVPMAERAKAWSSELPEAQQRLVYPDRRSLKGESQATRGTDLDIRTAGEAGKRQLAYQQPEERGAAPPGSKGGKKGSGTAEPAAPRPSGAAATGVQDPGHFGLGGGTTGRSARWGLLLPTLILGAYVGYAVANWRTLAGTS